jgi:hypothetical protein
MRVNFNFIVKNGVLGVPGVLPCNHAGFDGTPEKTAGVPGVPKAAENTSAEHRGTPEKITGVPLKPAPILEEHHGTPRTPEKTCKSFDNEAFEERAAIIEYDGGLSRTEAERLARGL